MSILVTGGAGYIGSHTCVELLNEGYEVVVVDNLCNACKESLVRVEQITGKHIKFYENDIRDEDALDRIFENEDIEAVIHFAGLKAVGESVAKPLEYYFNNITGTLRGETNTSNIQMLLNIVDLNPYNYMYIADFDKYYFITSILNIKALFNI